jgi:hypothetical protein
MIDPQILWQIEQMAEGIQQQINKQGRPMLSTEQAAMMVTFYLQEASKLLFNTLQMSVDDRFDLGIQLEAWRKELLGEV